MQGTAVKILCPPDNTCFIDRYCQDLISRGYSVNNRSKDAGIQSDPSRVLQLISRQLQ